MTEKEQKVLDLVHDKEFEMLCKIDDVCRKHNINYFVEAGSLIGAVRHGDLIPWDDDIDIYLKRKDYEKLLKYKEELEPYFIHVPNPDDNSFWDYTARVMDKSVLLKKNDKEAKFYKHIHCQYQFIDLFIMDNIKSGFRGKKMIMELKVLYVLATSKRYKLQYIPPKNPVAKFGVYVLCHLGMFIPLKWLFKRYDKVSRRFNKDKTCKDYVLSNGSATFISQSIYKKEWYKDKAELSIRGRKFYVPIGYAESLESYYGDYMELPPEEERIPTHIENFNDVSINGVKAIDLI